MKGERAKLLSRDGADKSCLRSGRASRRFSGEKAIRIRHLFTRIGLLCFLLSGVSAERTVFRFRKRQDPPPSKPTPARKPGGERFDIDPTMTIMDLILTI
jgi:hypothetical protein